MKAIFLIKIDIIYLSTKYECNIKKKKKKKKKINVIPIFAFKDQYINFEKNFSKRKNLMFVGRFLEIFNIVAVNWFSKEIYPKIVEKNFQILFGIF